MLPRLQPPRRIADAVKFFEDARKECAAVDLFCGIVDADHTAIIADGRRHVNILNESYSINCGGNYDEGRARQGAVFGRV